MLNRAVSRLRGWISAGSTLDKVAGAVVGACLIVAIANASQLLRSGDMVFNADIARDFLLFHELDKDPVMLIGPRADYKGLFHGPAWLYLNYPAYLVGQGNPLAVSLFWFILSGACAIGYIWIGKKLFDTRTGLVFAALSFVTALYYIPQFYNPTGAMFIAPLFIYCANMYVKTGRLLWMVGQLFLAGMMLQFQLAAGIPLVILSSAALLCIILKRCTYSHLLGFLVMLVPLGTFIVFELKFGFPQLQAIIRHFDGSEVYYSLSFVDKLADRYGRLIGPGLGFFAGKYSGLSLYPAVFMGSVLAVAALEDKENRRAKSPGVAQGNLSVYWWSLYYFLGFYVLSFIHNGSVLTHYYVPFVLIPLLLFASMHKWLDRKLYYVIVVAILLVNLGHIADVQEELLGRRGKHFTSWVSLQRAIQPVYDAADDGEVGLLVYAPDAYAYAPKYAALFVQRQSSEGRVKINEKLSTTYLLYEPAPDTAPWLNGAYWKSDLVGIATEPVRTYEFESGYRLEEFMLDEADVTSPIDPLALDWVSQR